MTTDEKITHTGANSEFSSRPTPDVPTLDVPAPDAPTPDAFKPDIPTPKQRLSVNLQEAQRWIEAEPDGRFKKIKQKMVDHLQCVPHEVFLSALKRCIARADALIGDRLYGVLWDYKPHTSKRWTYEQTKDGLNHLPVAETYFGFYDEIEDFESFRKLLDQGIDTFVVVDDAVYSGEQFLNRILSRLMELYQKYDYYPARNPSIIFIVPYSTSDFLQSAAVLKAQELGILTIITDQSMPVLREILTPEELVILGERGGELDLPEQQKARGVLDQNSEQLYLGATLTAFDHGVGDGHSFCEPLAYRLGLRVEKPYKQLESDYYQQEAAEFERYMRPKLAKHAAKQGKSDLPTSPQNEDLI